LVTGCDLVVEQIKVAAGIPLSISQEDVSINGSAIECRIYAEDPERNFLPSPGKLTTYQEPNGPGVRNDSGVYQGFRIPFEYDPLISKLITHGRDRDESIRRMQRALAEYKVGGVKSTIPFFIRLLQDPRFLKGDIHTHFLEQQKLIQDDLPPDVDSSIPLIGAAIKHLSERRSSTSHPQVRKSGWKEYGRRFWQ
jgi:acetyl/propionyl-CoA carboxylase alpha subunit